MKKFFFTILLLSTIEASNKDINFYLKQNAQRLNAYHQAVKQASNQKQYIHFRNFLVIDAKSYFALNREEKKTLDSQITLVAFYKRGTPLYNNFGGVSLDGVLAEDIDEKRAKILHYSFDGRYFTDLDNVLESHIIYAYCKLPRFNQCILLGIGEMW